MDSDIVNRTIEIPDSSIPSLVQLNIAQRESAKALRWWVNGLKTIFETCTSRKDVLSGDISDDMYAAHTCLEEI